jgi:hypothetical protein
VRHPAGGRNLQRTAPIDTELPLPDGHDAADVRDFIEHAVKAIEVFERYQGSSRHRQDAKFETLAIVTLPADPGVRQHRGSVVPRGRQSRPPEVIVILRESYGVSVAMTCFPRPAGTPSVLLLKNS